MPHPRREGSGYTEQRWTPRENPNTVLRQPSTILSAISRLSSPRSPKSAPIYFPQLVAALMNADGVQSSSAEEQVSGEGGQVNKGGQQARRRTEADGESNCTSIGEFSPGESGSLSSELAELSSGAAFSRDCVATRRTVDTTPMSLNTPKEDERVQQLPDSTRRSRSEESSAERLDRGFSFPPPSNLARPRPQGNPGLASSPSPRPSSSRGHQRRGSSTDAYFVASPTSFSPQFSSRPHLNLADVVPPSPPPFHDLAASSPKTPIARAPPSSFSRPSMGGRSKSSGSVVGKLKKKASISFRSALGSGATEQGGESHRCLSAAAEISPVSTMLATGIATSPGRSHTLGRASSSRARPSLQLIDFNAAPLVTPISPVELDTRTRSPDAVPLPGRAPTKARRRANTSHGESRGFLSNLLKLKKSTGTLRGDRTAPPRTPPPPLPADLPISSLRPAAPSRRQSGDHSTPSTGSSLKGPHPAILHISRQREERGSAGESSSETRASSRSRWRQDPSNESLPLTSSPASGSYLANTSSDNLSSARQSFSERRRAASSTRSATSARSYHTFSDHGHAPSPRELDQLPPRREKRGNDVPGGRIADFGELVRSLPKTSNASSITTINTLSTVDSRSPYTTALSPPPRRPPRHRSSTTASSPSSSSAAASPRNTPPDRPPRSASRPTPCPST